MVNKSAGLRQALSVCVMAMAMTLCATADSGFLDPEIEAQIARILDKTPLIDGHNDLPWEIRDRFGSDLDKVDLLSDTSLLPVPESPHGLLPLMTDIPRLRAGKMGGQFWSVWIPPEITGADAVKLTIEQIDLVKSLVARYPRHFQMAYSANDIARCHRAGKIASLIGVEGGHQIDGSLAVLRQLYFLGARYLTLTHSLTTEWADSATDHALHDGLSPLGHDVVSEMNRIGMLVDLSHVSEVTMAAVLDIALAPVMFSHSSARALNSSPRNVSDDILKRLPENGGVVMVNFYSGFISEPWLRWLDDYEAERARLSGAAQSDDADSSDTSLSKWLASNPEPVVTIGMVADHIEHIRDVAGMDHVGLGSDFDGIDAVPSGLDSPAAIPLLLAELIRRGWSDEELSKLAGGNILRALREAERTAQRLQAAGSSK